MEDSDKEDLGMEERAEHLGKDKKGKEELAESHQDVDVGVLVEIQDLKG